MSDFSHVPVVDIDWLECDGVVTGTVGGCLIGSFHRGAGLNPHSPEKSRVTATWTWSSNSGLNQQAMLAIVKKQGELNAEVFTVPAEEGYGGS